MMRLVLAISICVLTGCTRTTSPSASQPPSASSSPIAGTESPSATASRPTVTGSGTMVPSGRIAARGRAVPAEHRYVVGATQTAGRVWLVDLDRGTSVDVIVTSGVFAPLVSESRDGRRLVVGALGPNGRAGLYLVEVEAGKTSLLYEDPQVDSGLQARISADGARYAFADSAGVRIGDTVGGATTQLIAHPAPDAVGGSWYPMGWSPDGTWLALSRATESESVVGVVRVSNGTLADVGRGTSIAWRGRAPQLVVASGVSAFGGRSEMYTFEPTTGGHRQLEPIGSKRMGSPLWHPTEDRLLFLATDQPTAAADVYVRSLADPAAARIAAARKVLDAWWSRDGSKIYAIATREDAVGAAPGVANLEILELPSGRVVATVCRQDPRASCP